MKLFTPMRSLFLFFFLLLPSFLMAETTAVAPMAGDGSDDNPYQVSNLAELRWVSETESSWDKSFLITADIDAADTTTWNDGKGFSPIGKKETYFYGKFSNPDAFVISNVFINRPLQDGVGFFGYTSWRGEFTSIRLEACDIIGDEIVGGLVGSSSSKIKDCSVTGRITARRVAGGLIGRNKGIILKSYAKVIIESGVYAGGLVGENGKYSSVVNSYATGSVSATSSYAGGLVGYMKNKSIINNSYASTELSTDSSSEGGLVGRYDGGEVTNCFFDIEVSGVITAIGSSDMPTLSGAGGLTTAGMKSKSNYINAGWDCDYFWDISGEYPQ